MDSGMLDLVSNVKHGRLEGSVSGHIVWNSRNVKQASDNFHGQE